jgi:hypothetical protein
MRNQQIIDLAQITAELALREPAIKKREEESQQSILAALKGWERDKARERFEISLAWNQLHEFTHDWRESLNGNGRLTFIVDAWFLQDLIR